MRAGGWSETPTYKIIALGPPCRVHPRPAPLGLFLSRRKYKAPLED
jgi:hypothetical protein